MRILIVLFFIFLLSHRLDAADDGAGPSSVGPGLVNPGTGPHQSASSPAALRAVAIQRQLESIETELSIVRAAVRVLAVQPYHVPLHGRLTPHDKLTASNRVPLHAMYRFASCII